MTRAWRIAALVGGSAVAITWAVTEMVLPGVGAGALLHPMRRAYTGPPPAACENAQFRGAGVTLAGWRCSTTQPRRGTVVYLHGVADNRGSARGHISRLLPRGFDVVAYDSRANGASTGTLCTYGFYEKQDLHRVIDTLPPGPVVLLGHSLGAAVALQEAPDDSRITTVVAAETFSDLRTVVTERAPLFFTRNVVRRAFALTEAQAAFDVDEVSPVKAAARLTIPVLLIHGDADVNTPPEHSRRVVAALKGPKRLVLVPGAHHGESLGDGVWSEVDAWLDRYVPRSRASAVPAASRDSRGSASSASRSAG
jgi:pimeloyl-ACP methyl ester carboxylesterase